MINSRNDVIKFVHDMLDSFEITEWKIGDVSLWKLRGDIGEFKNLASVLIYEPIDDSFYFITNESLENKLKCNALDVKSTEWDEWPCTRSFGDDDYFQKMVSLDTNIEVIEPKNSLLLTDIVDKITSSQQYKEKEK